MTTSARESPPRGRRGAGPPPGGGPRSRSRRPRSPRTPQRQPIRAGASSATRLPSGKRGSRAPRTHARPRTQAHMHRQHARTHARGQTAHGRAARSKQAQCACTSRQLPQTKEPARAAKRLSARRPSGVPTAEGGYGRPSPPPPAARQPELHTICHTKNEYILHTIYHTL